MRMNVLEIFRKKEAPRRWEIAPGITRDKERVYFSRKTNIGSNGEVSIKVSDIIKAGEEALEIVNSRKK